MSHPLTHWRDQYPTLEKKVYLASHSLGCVPTATRLELDNYWKAWVTNGINAWEHQFWEAIEGFTHRLERVLGAPKDTVVPLQNATRAMAAVASCFDFKTSRNRIVMTDLEFTTAYPFWRRCERIGAEVVIVTSDDGISVPVDKIAAAIDDRTLLVMTSHAYFRSGALQDLAGLAEVVHENGALLLGDGYQAVGTVPVNTVELDVDFYVGGCHKWLSGGPGAGYLYVKEALIQTLEPRLTGWFGLERPFEYEAGTSSGRLSPVIRRFFGGTPNIPGIYAAQAGLRNVEEIGVAAIREVSRGLTEQLRLGALERGYEVRTPADFESRNGMICMKFEGAERAVAGLEAQQIIVDWRPDCGMRVSPHFYNSSDDIGTFFEALDGMA